MREETLFQSDESRGGARMPFEPMLLKGAHEPGCPIQGLFKAK
jgi:hypothetical protein